MALLEVNGIGKSFGATKVLRDISFDLAEGEALAIIGSSGSGKTTLLRCLNFLETADTGSITVAGETLWSAADTKTQSEEAIRKKRLHFGLVFQNFNLCSAGGVSAAEADRGDFIEAGRRIPIVQPFSGLRMRGGAKHHDQRMFLRSFGKRTDPFPTLLASELYPFAFWYEDDPSSGCIRFLTETECERLMGLPEGWTKYGADGREICSTNRYTALGNAIALPCAEYIMAGIAEVLGK